MKSNDKDKLNAKVLFENGHVEKYTRDFFVKHGKKGGKNGGGKWFNSLSKEKQQEHIDKMIKSRGKNLST